MQTTTKTGKRKQNFVEIIFKNCGKNCEKNSEKIVGKFMEKIMKIIVEKAKKKLWKKLVLRATCARPHAGVTAKIK